MQESKTSRQPSLYEGFKIIDIDDPDRLLNLGNIDGSCQNVTREARYSKCLLSYILDGKNRGILVTNQEGKMVARAIIRLLWDPLRKEAVLLKERSYPLTGLDPTIAKALDEACKRRALELNIPLISDKPTDSPYLNEVRSLGGRAPSEMVDSGPGKTGNQWSLTRTYYFK